MTQQLVGYEDSDIPLQSGRLRVRRWGAADAPAVLCVPGLSANLCGFDRLAGRLAGDALQLVAIDLRGRGRSEVTGAGTYGWGHHARDVLAIAGAVGAPSFAVIAQSSGAAIAMTCAQLEPSRVERLVLVDLAGSPDERAAVPVAASVSRLGTVYPSAQAAIALIKQTGIVPEWDEYWDRYFTYELRDVEGGVTASSDRGAVLEDPGTATRCTGPARMRRSTHYGPRSPCRRWCCPPGGRSCPSWGSSCPPPNRSGSRRRCHQHVRWTST
jgi:3-oxoadipate enol-lactonase